MSNATPSGAGRAPIVELENAQVEKLIMQSFALYVKQVEAEAQPADDEEQKTVESVEKPFQIYRDL